MNHTSCPPGSGTDPARGGPAAPAVALFLLMSAVALSPGCSTREAARSPGAGASHPGRISDPGAFITADTGARIMPGDQIQVSVWGYPEFDVTTLVKPSGTVMIPLIGEMKAADMTKEEFTAQLRAKLVEFVKEEPSVNVSVSSVAGMKVSVMGAVTRQDNYPLTGEASLVEVLMSAGGATPEADLRHVMIYRDGIPQNSINVDLSGHMQRGEIHKMPKVKIGDTVFIPRQENLIRDLSGFVGDVIVMFGLFGLVR